MGGSPEGSSSESEFEANVDDMEEEDLLFMDEKVAAKGKNAGKKNALDRTGDTNADDLEIQEDEADDTVFIDNLPKDEASLRTMIKDVNYHIRELERQFFEEEDSDEEDELKQNLVNSNITEAEHNMKLEKLKEKSHIQQFWTIPMSENVTALGYEHLAKSQMENSGGRLFDVITCDPPWQLSSANPTRGVAIAYETLNDR